MKKERKLILSFSFIFVYLLSVQFEGILLNELLHASFIASGYYMTVSIWSLFAGLVLGIFMINDMTKATQMLKINTAVLIVSMISFIFGFETVWYFFITLSGVTSGLALVSFGYYFKLVSKEIRIKVIAYSLVLSNLLLTLINFIQHSFNVQLSFFILSAFLMLAMFLLPQDQSIHACKTTMIDYQKHRFTFIKLWVFILTVTMISGLMYKIINPSFNHLEVFDYTWVIPYVLSILYMSKKNYLQVKVLNGGAFQILFSFIFYLLIPYDLLRYLVVDGLLLFGLGIFDYFWWGILSDLLDSSQKPQKIVGFILSANVLGILVGRNMGYWLQRFSISNASLVIVLMIILFLVIMMNTPLVYDLETLFKTSSFDVELLEVLTDREEECNPAS